MTGRKIPADPYHRPHILYIRLTFINSTESSPPVFTVASSDDDDDDADEGGGPSFFSFSAYKISAMARRVRRYCSISFGQPVVFSSAMYPHVVIN